MLLKKFDFRFSSFIPPAKDPLEDPLDILEDLRAILEEHRLVQTGTDHLVSSVLLLIRYLSVALC